MPQKAKKFEPLPEASSRDDFSAYTFFVKTIQGAAIKSLTDVLKDIVHEGTFRINSTGVRCHCINGSKTCFVNLMLHADRFDVFHCQEREVHVSLGMEELSNLVSFCGSNDQLSLFQERAHPDKMVILIETQTQDSKMEKRWRLCLKALDIYDVSMDATEYLSIITLDSSWFHSTCRGCSKLSDTLIIESLRDRLRIGVSGQRTEGFIEITQTKNCHFRTTSEKEYRASFALRFLLLFTKAGTLSKNVEMYLAEDYPMSLRFMIADLGELHLSQSAIMNLEDDDDAGDDGAGNKSGEDTDMDDLL